MTWILGLAASVGKSLLGNPALIALLLVSAAFAVVTISKNSEIDTLQKDINDPKTGWVARYDAAQRDNGTLQNNNATLSNSLATQSASIDALATQAKASGAKFDQLIAAQANTRAAVARQFVVLDNAKPGADKCQSAGDLIRSTAQ